MKIAVTYEDGIVFPHFGHTEAFKIYNIEEGKITDAKVVPTGDAGHGALAGFLLNNNVNALICGGIGSGAVNILNESGIEICNGVTGPADQAVEAYLQNRLGFDPNNKCQGHEAGHEDGHDCGGHGHGCENH